MEKKFRDIIAAAKAAFAAGDREEAARLQLHFLEAVTGRPQPPLSHPAALCRECPGSGACVHEDAGTYNCGGRSCE